MTFRYVPKRFECDWCNEDFMTPEELEAHIWEHHEKYILGE